MHYPIETRTFRGHLSIAKATKYASLDVHSIHIPPIQASEVDTLYLIESRPHLGKTCYIQTAAFKLDKPKR